MSCSLEEPRQGAAASTIRPRASRLRRALQPLAAFVLGTTVLLVLLELGLRVTGAFAPPPDLPGMARLAELEEATSRVLCVGDSYTYGIGASEGMDYPRQLEAALNGRLGPEERVAVVNAGIAGANSSMMLEALPGFLAAVEPDLVVLLAGTANATNYYGFQGGRPSEGPRARLERALFDVRVYRLWHLVRNHMGLGRARTLAAVPTGVDGAVAGYLLWARERTRLGGGLGSLSPGFLEGAISWPLRLATPASIAPLSCSGSSWSVSRSAATCCGAWAWRAGASVASTRPAPGSSRPSGPSPPIPTPTAPWRSCTWTGSASRAPGREPGGP